MENLKRIIAKNLSELRRAASMTQIELAQKLNYSDKAVSKWERGESVPDVAVLKQIADLFGVSVDYLLVEDHTSLPRENMPTSRSHRRGVITLLSVALVWLLATAAFVCIGIAAPSVRREWLLFLYAVPVSAVVLLVFNTLWGRLRRNYAIVSVLVWSVLLASYLTYPRGMMWMLLLLGIPAQVIIWLWSHLKK